MMATRNVDNTQDYLDSRDIIARISELEEDDQRDEIDDEEMATLKALADEAEGYAPDWDGGQTLIRDSYFKTYAMELAEDIGALPRDAAWPAYHIDWDAAVLSLQMDYTSVEFDGVTYWIRG